MVSNPNVVDEVVARSLCCGCGVCAGICPKSALEMRFNSLGEFVPARCGHCAECQLCLNVCPALDRGQPLSPEELFGATSPGQEDPHLGRSVAALVGYSSSHRARAASGGMTTWLLEELLRRKKIDAAVCVGLSQRKDRLFEPKIVSSVSELAARSSSRYYPVEFSSMLRHVLHNEGNYAVVALPCVVAGIRKARRALPALRRRIRYVLALVCGHGVSKGFTSYLLALAGLDENSAADVDFRFGRFDRAADDYAFRALSVRGQWSRPQPLSGLYGRLWAGRFFVPNACEFCGDLFAPTADATFMDAWLPEYTSDSAGTSLLVVRLPELALFFEQARADGRCRLDTVSLERIRRSQGAALAYKTVFLPLRVARARKQGLTIPRDLPTAAIPCGIRERLAKIKHQARNGISRRVFDRTGRARSFWVSVLTAQLRSQSMMRASRKWARRARNRVRRLIPGRMTEAK